MFTVVVSYHAENAAQASSKFADHIIGGGLLYSLLNTTGLLNRATVFRRLLRIRSPASNQSLCSE